jgi:hypothetical protein
MNPSDLLYRTAEERGKRAGLHLWAQVRRMRRASADRSDVGDIGLFVWLTWVEAASTIASSTDLSRQKFFED